jgi:mono/diheme cytochrome c family protein
MNASKITVLGLLATTALLGSCASNTVALNVAAAGDVAATTPATVDNFMLVSQDLEAYELHRLNQGKAVVIVTQANGDAEIRRLAPALNALKAKYGSEVEFVALNSNLKDSRESVQAEVQKTGLKLPVLMDHYQLVGESLGVTRSAEVVIVDPKTWSVVYRGAAADAGAALEAKLAGKPMPTAGVSKGMVVAFPERARQAQFAKISYAKDVAPIIEKNCVACHQEGGIGPFAMTDYAKVKGFAPMIREVIRTDRMPPYNADPHVNKFSDNKNMTAAEIKTLVHWIEAGAPRGEGGDPLAAVKRVAPEWPLGKPDLVLNIPAYKVPASGIVDYQRPYTVNTTTEGKWIRASTVKPGDRRAVHHVLTGWMKDVPANGVASETRWRGSVGGYAVGAESEVYDGDVGTYLPAGGAVGYQMHYTPYGKETVDNSQIGLYFRKDPPKYIMRDIVVIDATIELQPNTARHKETAYVYFPNDALLYSAFPHAHYRAYANDLWLETPDGKRKLLLSMPRYDFNWQRSYTFAEPVKIPAGSKVVANWVYDNSKGNPSNPDPTIKVTWGEQSHEEMLFTSLSFRWLDETAAKQVDSDARFGDYRMFGMMDDSRDMKLQKAELRGQMGQMLGQYFSVIDKNADGGLDVAEMKAAQALLPNRRRAQSQAAENAALFNGNPNAAAPAPKK